MTDNKGTIDFSQYSDEALNAALERIDRDKFSENYKACLNEIEKRKNNKKAADIVDTPLFSKDNPEETVHLFSYHGVGTDLALLFLKNLFFTIITLGFYSPWARTNTRRFYWSNTAFKGDRFTYTGTGKELFVGWLKLLVFLFPALIAVNIITLLVPKPFEPAVGLLVLPVYIYIFALATYAGLRYRALRTLWRQIRFDVNRDKAQAREFNLLYFKGVILSGLTLGIYTPFFTINKHKFLVNRTNYGGVKFSFDGDGTEYFLLCVKGLFLSLITLGLYLPWFFISRMQYRMEKTHMGPNSFHLNITGGQILGYTIVGYLAVFLTLGLATPWVINKFFHLFFSHLSLKGTLNLDGVKNIQQSGSAVGDDLATAYEVDFGF